MFDSSFNITSCFITECGIAGVLFIASVIYFPNKPPTAPSYTASLNRIEYTKSLSKIIRQDCVYICVNTMQFHETYTTL